MNQIIIKLCSQLSYQFSLPVRLVTRSNCICIIFCIDWTGILVNDCLEPLSNLPAVSESDVERNPCNYPNNELRFPVATHGISRQIIFGDSTLSINGAHLP